MKPPTRLYGIIIRMKHSLKQECCMANCLVPEGNVFGPSGYVNLNCPPAVSAAVKQFHSSEKLFTSVATLAQPWGRF
jgi:hypothetical protein